jgi:hypothetical protein
LGEDHVFVGDRDAVEWSAVLAALDFSLGGAGFSERRLGEDGDEGVDLAVELVDALEAGPCQLDGRELAGSKARRHVGDNA